MYRLPLWIDRTELAPNEPPVHQNGYEHEGNDSKGSAIIID